MIDSENRRIHRWALGFALVFVFGITNFFCAYAFDRIPHVQDSIAQLFHAKIFASGKLYASSHALPEFFHYTHVINDGKWYSQYPPGHSLLLMLGLFVGAPWIVNPLFGTLAVGVTFALARTIHGSATALIALGLMSSSPFLLFMASGFMSHTTAMFCVALFALFFARTLQHPTRSNAVVAGLALGYAVLIRPYSTFAVALPFIVWAAFRFARHPRVRGPLLYLGGGTVSLLAVLFAFNWITNGGPFTLAYEVLYGPEVGVGFGRGAWGEPHTPAAGLANTSDLIAGLGFHLFGWWQLSLVPICLLLLSRRMRDFDYLFLASFASLCTFYFFYWYQDLCFGPRYLFESVPFLVILSARGLVEFPRAVSAVFARASGGERSWVANATRGAVALAVVGAMLYSGFVSFPSLLFGDPSGFDYEDRGYARSHWSVDAYLGRLVESEASDHALVFVDLPRPGNWQRHDWFGSAFLHLTPELDGEVVFAQDLGGRNVELMRHFPDRDVYVYRGDLREGTLTRVRREGDSWVSSAESPDQPSPGRAPDPGRE